MVWLSNFSHWLQQRWQHLRKPPHIPAEVWKNALAPYPFLAQLPEAQDQQLQTLVAHFLQRKEFTGAHGLQVTDEMAIAIAAQACILLLHWRSPAHSLRWYDHFVGIVVQPHDVIARRHVVDEAGVVHSYEEELMCFTWPSMPA